MPKKPIAVRDNQSPLDKYMDRVEKLAENFAPKPFDPGQFVTPEPVRFKSGPSNLEALVNDIMSVLDDHTIEEIHHASNIVMGYVSAQAGRYGPVFIRPSV